MRIGFVQFAPELANLHGTIKRLEELCEGRSLGDLVVLPELCNSGYSFQDRTQAWASSENCNDSRFLRFLQAICRRRQCHIVSGFNERDGNRLYNTAVLVGPEGLIGKYRKMHLFLDEKDYFEPGDTGLGIWDIPQCRVGMLICFDWVFPEVWRILALKGADIICHPSNLVLPGFAQRGIPAHAMINRIFTVTANRIGTERDLTFTGNSIICDPRGNIIAQAPADDECVLAVEIDLAQARDKMITSRNHVLNDRRPGEYSDLAK
jgi:predicted amidohydrolase